MRTIAVIPARFRSKRLPGKPLADIGGHPLVEHVYRRSAEARLVERVLVATEDRQVRDAVAAFGGACVMTSPDHPSGTDRVAEAVADLDVDLVVNVQGDEPFIEPSAIDQAVAACQAEKGHAISTLASPISSPHELWDPNVVKVVRDLRGFALYFSRWPIPFVASPEMSREEVPRRFERAAPPQPGSCLKHIGLYVYPKPLLLRLTQAKPSPLERLEKLEQLRALENGVPIRVEETDCQCIGVDTPEDLEQVRKVFSEREGSAAGSRP
jgi:3-deoxy-manno-octulosonate cytidylyltransferase (CMP-KDO synthetase)